MGKIKFIKHNIFGSTIYRDITNTFELVKNASDGKLYIKMASEIPVWQGDGFNNVEEAESFLEEYNWDKAKELEIVPRYFEHDLNFLLMMYGFAKLDEPGEYLKEIPGGYICIRDLGDDKSVEVYTLDNSEVYDNLDDVCKRLDEILNLYDINIFSCATICNPFNTKQTVEAAISTRDLSRNMVRVKSSNMWAYTINIREPKDKTGDVLAQFKGPKGGPGDIYIYYDVPVALWRRWIAAPSKGHFFWQYIRNNFKYSKLTGDKRGKLKNAINH